MATCHRHSETTRTLAILVAIDIAGPLAAAFQLGDDRWQEALDCLARQIERDSRLPVQRGITRFVAAFNAPDEALAFARAMLASGNDLSLPLRTVVHAGEVIVTHDGPAGVAVMTALDALQAAAPGELLVTQPAYAMCEGDRADLEFGMMWEPDGLPVRWRLCREAGSSSAARPPGPPPEVLSPREREVVSLIAAGKPNRDIADALTIAVGTVERHVANILRKLHFRSRAQVARWAIEWGLGGSHDAGP